MEAKDVRRHELVRGTVVLDDVDVGVDAVVLAHGVRERVLVELVRVGAHGADEGAVHVERQERLVVARRRRHGERRDRARRGGEPRRERNGGWASDRAERARRRHARCDEPWSFRVEHGFDVVCGWLSEFSRATGKQSD